MPATVDELREAGTPTTLASRIAVLRLHADPRIRSLCARHPNLPPEAYADLARDGISAVRVAIAHRSGLPAEVAAPLFVDLDRRVRRAAFRHQPFDARQMQRVMERRAWTPQVLEWMRASLVGDVALTASLFADSRWRWIASSGSFDRTSLKPYSSNVQALTMIVRNGHLTHGAALWLARCQSPAVQELVGLRNDTVGRRALLVATLGRKRAAAGLASRRPPRLLRAVLWCRPSRSIRVATASVSTSQWKLVRASLSSWFAMEYAIAANAHAGPSARSRLFLSTHPGVHEMLARRDDLRPIEWRKLTMWSPVELAVASNPSAPFEVVRGLLSSPDPMVRAMASLHPSLPLDRRLQIAGDGNAPKWVLRRCATGADVPVADRERIQVWLALGGGTGDPNFDPVSCSGTPGDLGQPRDAAFLAAVPGPARSSSLWYARVLGARGKGRLAFDDIRALAADGHPAVREAAAGYNYSLTLRALQDDLEPRVRRRAEQTWAGLPSRQRAELRVLLSRTAVLTGCVGVIVLAALAGPSSGQEGSGTAPPGLSTLIDAVQTPAWTFVEPSASTAADCDAGGNRVWVERDGLTTMVHVETRNARTPLTFHVESPLGGSRYVMSQELSSGQAGEWETFTAGGLGSVDVTIGDRPTRVLRVPFDVAVPPTFFDLKGDC